MREHRIPKRGGKLRSLGIPTAADRTVQAALKLVLEPIFEADFKPCSHGFRPGRSAHDAIAEVRHYAAHGYSWVVEGDITACFDTIDHTALMDRVRQRVGDKRVLALVKAFLKAGVLTKDAGLKDTTTGTPQGGILSPLLSNIALSVLDEHFNTMWTTTMATPYRRKKRRQHGQPNYRLTRYADDFVVTVHGDRADAEDLRDQIAQILAPMGLELSQAKTHITHIDEGLVFLGYRIQRHRKRGTNRRFVYTYPSKNAVAAIKAKVKTYSREDRDKPLADLLRRLNLVLRGWTNYFRHGACKATLGYLRAYSWQRVILWLRRKPPRRQLEAASTPLPARLAAHRWGPDAVRPSLGAGALLPLPRQQRPDPMAHRDDNRVAHRDLRRAGCVGTRTSGSAGGPGKRTFRKEGTAPRSDQTTPLRRCCSNKAYIPRLYRRCSVTLGSPSPSTPTAMCHRRCTRGPPPSWRAS